MIKVSYQTIIELAEQRNLYQEFSIEKDTPIEDFFNESILSKEDYLLEYTILSTPKYKKAYDQALFEFSKTKPVQKEKSENKKILKIKKKLFFLKPFVWICLLSFILAIITFFTQRLLETSNDTQIEKNILSCDDGYYEKSGKCVSMFFENGNTLNKNYFSTTPTVSPRKSVESYFFYLQSKEFENAFSLFGEKKQLNAKGFLAFKEWLADFEEIQNKKITLLESLSSDEEKVFLAEFKMSFSEKNDLDSKWLFYVHPMDGGWFIFKSLVPYENGWDDSACDLYDGFDICKKTKEIPLPFLRKLIEKRSDISIFLDSLSLINADSILDNTDEKITIFIPTDEAFYQIPENILTDLFKEENKASLDTLIAYHIVPGIKKISDFSNGIILSTLLSDNGILINLDKDGQFLLNRGAYIIGDAIEGSNGIVYFIDSVLIPQDFLSD